VNARAAHEVIERSRRLTGKEMRRLVRAQNQVSGLLGIGRSWNTAAKAVRVAMDDADRTTEVRRLEGEAFFSVILAAITEATAKGKDTAELVREAERFRAANHGRSDWSEGADRFTRCLRRTIGWRAPSRIGLAAVAAENAICALSTWDIAQDEGGYTTGNRRLLIRPWLTVASLPSNLRGLP
jgi:hypothetical protein